MRYDAKLSVRYITDDPVPISDIIASLQGAEGAIREAARLLPKIVDGLEVSKVEIKVRQIAQESPLRELFAIGLFLAYQEKLEEEVPLLISETTGVILPDRFDTLVTVLTMIVIFYGAGALKDLVFGKGKDGAAKVQLDGLIAEIAPQVGKSEKQIREVLEDRYEERKAWRRLANTASRFFAPSKRQNSAPVMINDRRVPQEAVRDIPAEYLVEDAGEERPSRFFKDAKVELRAEDKDHTGRGWACVIESVSKDRLKMKLVDEASADNLWGRNSVIGDVTVVYEKIGADLHPKEVHLHSVRS